MNNIGVINKFLLINTNKCNKSIINLIKVKSVVLSYIVTTCKSLCLPYYVQSRF